VSITGSDDGLVVTGTNGEGVIITGQTSGVTITGTTAIGVDIIGATDGVEITGTAGHGIDISGATSGAIIAASAGPGLSVSGTTYGFYIDASAGPGMRVHGTTFGLELDASAGDGLSTTGTTYGFQVVGGADGAFISAGDYAAIADAVWDEILVGAHNTNNSAGKFIRILGQQIIHTDTAQGAGSLGASNQIQLATDASSTDGAYDPAIVAIVSGTGSGQCRLILEYDGATRTATVDREWKVDPDATSEYTIIAHPGREHVNEGLVQAADATTVTLNALASSDDDAYSGQYVFIRSGPGSDQARRVMSYNGTTKVATLACAWTTTPDATSSYVMLASASLLDGCISRAVWDADLDTWDDVAGSTGATLTAIAAATSGPTGDTLYTHTEYEYGHDAEAGYEIPDVTVILYNNATATGDPIASGVTDEVGAVQFYLNAGTYYAFRRKAGRRFLDNPTTITVT
jgi:hypothetical protein